MPGIFYYLVMNIVENVGVFLKLKSEVFVEFQIFKALVEKESSCSITTRRLDSGGEFFSKDFKFFCANMGYKDNTPHPTRHSGMEWLRDEITELRRRLDLGCRTSQFQADFALKRYSQQSIC